MAGDTSMKIAVKAASYNMIMQVIFRFGTFFMNAILLRYISREVLGVVNVRLALLYTTILFGSREAFRKACLTRSEHDKKDGTFSVKQRKKIINLIWLSVIVGVCSVTLLCGLWMFYLQQPSIDLLVGYQHCCVIIAISALIELLVEPLWIFGQRYSYVTLKVVLEGILVTLRCIISTSLVILFPNFGIYCFAVGFLVSAFAYVFLYYAYFWWCIMKIQKTASETKEVASFPFDNFADIFPDWEAPFEFPSYYKLLVVSFYKQSLLKQFLTEGERYVMTVFSILSFGEQGIYDVINNLGSLAARFIFMPIEESYYIYYSQILIRGKNANEHSKELLNKAAGSLSIVLKFVSLVGLIIFVFGHNYSYLLLDLYGGKLLSESEGPLLLKMYCLYVLIIAVNGITECFMFAAMSKQSVDNYNYKMLGFSIVFLSASLFFTKYFGAIGFIFANCINMGLRICQSVLFIIDFFKETDLHPLSSVFPSYGVIATLILSFVTTYISERFLSYEATRLYQFLHVVIGGLCLLVVCASIYLTETKLIQFGKDLISRRKEKLK